MKVALVCQSLLLSRALKSFLGDTITPYKQCDFVISDKKIELDKPVFLLSHSEGDLIIPFSKSALLIELDKFFKSLNAPKMVNTDPLHHTLEEKIAQITDKFRAELIETIRGYYAK